MRRARWKRKNVRDELTVEAANSPIRRSSRFGLPPKSGNLLPAALKVRKEPSASPHLEAGHLPGCKPERLSATVPCVPLRYALPGPFSALSSSLALRPLGGWFFLPRPSSPGGVSKGEGPQSRPFVPRGGMGDGWRPPCFGWGSKREGALRQRLLPLAP